MDAICRSLTEKQKLILGILARHTASITALADESNLDFGELVSILEELKVRSLVGSSVEQAVGTSQKILFRINQVLKLSKQCLV